MDGFVERALVEDSNDTDTGSESISPPQFLYVGYDDRGCSRIHAGLDARRYNIDSAPSVAQSVTNVPIKSINTNPSVEANNENPIPVPDPNGTPLGETTIESDACLLTSHLTNQHKIAELEEIAAEINDCPVFAFLSTTGGWSNIDRVQLSKVFETTVIFDESIIEQELCGSVANEGPSKTDTLIQQYVTNVIELPIVPGPIGVDYADVWSLWTGGQVGVPFTAALNINDLELEAVETSITMLKRDNMQGTDWFAYASAGPQITVEKFDQLKRSLSSMLVEDIDAGNGVFTGNVQANLGEKIILSGVLFQSAKF